MPRKAYGGVSNTSKNGIKIYGGVNNLSKKIIAGYVGVGNVSKRFWPAGDTPIYKKLIIFKNGQFISVPDDFDFEDYREVVCEDWLWSDYYNRYIAFNSISSADNVIWFHSASLFDIYSNIKWTVEDVKIDSGYDVDIVNPYILNEILIKTNVSFGNRDNLYCKVIFIGHVTISIYRLERNLSDNTYRLKLTETRYLNSEQGQVSEVEFPIKKSSGVNYPIHYIGINAEMNGIFSYDMNEWIANNIGVGDNSRFEINRAYAEYGYPLSSGGWEVRGFELLMTMQVSTVWSFCFRNDIFSSLNNDVYHNIQILLSKGPFDLKFTEYREGQVYEEEYHSSTQFIYNSEIFYIYYNYIPLNFRDWRYIYEENWRPYGGWEVSNSIGFLDESVIIRFCYEFLNSIEPILWSNQVVDLEIIDKSRYG